MVELLLQLAHSSLQIPPQDVRKKREDFEKVTNACSSAVEHVEVGALPLNRQRSARAGEEGDVVFLFCSPASEPRHREED